MSFKKMTKRQYPPRLWALVGYPGSGKSSFATQMAGPLLVVDADHRFTEVLDLAPGEVLELSDSPADNVDADRIAAILAENMPGSGVETLVVDSLTAIMAPIVTQAMVDKDAGRIKNLAVGWRTKALAMRQLQDGVTCWGTDCLWIYHLQDGRDAKGKALTKATVSQTELARLTRSINLQLEFVQDGQRHGVKVVWARRGREGMILWDDTSTWAGMPERIEAEVYDGLSLADQAAIEQETPSRFPNPETAIAWGLEQGAFKALQHSRNAYNKLKKEQQPRTAQEMAALWLADVQARLLALNGEDDTGEGEATDIIPPVEAQPTGVEGQAGEGEAEATEGGGDEGDCPWCGVPALFHSGSFADCPAKPAGEVATDDPNTFTCQVCGQVLTDFQVNGKTWTVSQLIDIGQGLPDGGIICGPCLKKRKEAARVKNGK